MDMNDEVVATALYRRAVPRLMTPDTARTQSPASLRRMLWRALEFN